MTVLQQQCLLTYLGYNPGVIDGQLGPKTQAALECFKSDYGLGAEGLVGAVAGTLAKKTGGKTNTATNTAVQVACKYLQADGYYHIPKGADVQLSEHFKSSEFDCHGIGCCTETIINPKLVDYLEMIRNHFGMPVTLTSAYRCPVHNSAIHGATGSHHCRGNAADIVVRNHTPRTVSRFAEESGILGIGLYETNGDGHFVHVDTRTSKAFWYGQSQQYRSTFK